MTQVRATRAYVAGLGTAGSLLAGAAILFVLASAVVSFRGWPQVGAQPSAASVVVSPTQVASGSSTSQRLLAAVAASGRGDGSRARRGRGHRGGRRSRVGGRLALAATSRSSPSRSRAAAEAEA